MLNNMGPWVWLLVNETVAIAATARSLYWLQAVVQASNGQSLKGRCVYDE